MLDEQSWSTELKHWLMLLIMTDKCYNIFNSCLWSIWFVKKREGEKEREREKEGEREWEREREIERKVEWVRKMEREKEREREREREKEWERDLERAREGIFSEERDFDGWG